MIKKGSIEIKKKILVLINKKKSCLVDIAIPLDC